MPVLAVKVRDEPAQKLMVPEGVTVAAHGAKQSIFSVLVQLAYKPSNKIRYVVPAVSVARLIV